VSLIQRDAYAERRRELLRRLGDDAAAIFTAAPETIRNHDVHHEYRPDSNLWYLTGFPEPEAVLLVRTGAAPNSVLFVRPKDKEKEVWTGVRAGPEGARARYGVDAAHELKDLDELLPKYLEGRRRLHYRLGADPAFDRRVFRIRDSLNAPRRLGAGGPVEFVDPSLTVYEQRLKKRPEEIAALRKAAAITAEAHRAAMLVARPGIGEHEIEAVVEYVFRARGSARWGYPSIVGAGKNATVLHYVDNDAIAADGELILVDAGCEIDGYTADITRVFPASGRFSAPQRALYDVVLRAELAAIDACRAGTSFQTPHDVAVRALCEGFVELGLLKGDPEEHARGESYKRYYMHRTSHWLGLDVHDVGRYADGDLWRPLEPGHVLTIEPGCYVAEDDFEAPAEFRGIGIRIEDDILITERGPEVLTAGVPKEAADVEVLASRRTPMPSFD
jgi:Xaa-Pro aminopeptidase